VLIRAPTGCQRHGVYYEDSAVVIQHVNDLNHSAALPSADKAQLFVTDFPRITAFRAAHDRFDFCNRAAMSRRVLLIPLNSAEIPH